MKVVGSHGIYLYIFTIFCTPCFELDMSTEYLGGVVNCVLFWSQTFVESYDYPLAKSRFEHRIFRFIGL